MSGLAADQLREQMARRLEAMSLREWCRLTGCAASHVSEFVNGKRNPPSDMLDALNLEVRYVKRRATPSTEGRKGEDQADG